ncbi:helix-turn-helix transcriptional regulator [Ramlibacter rhizophilus]|uniref:LuxR family transcriptional regulator n=1 Tax=Ramlibacter rhizophilus TaxID=1781167 RepID=A0A4Z0BGZ7_9BURK|nr:helix-turn-helix transcriptional regulator [Ramlibacter rhizophilus]TFY97404.1 LuxR family transcriptional regulator [Ramlibacter rhizophilus]
MQLIHLARDPRPSGPGDRCAQSALSGVIGAIGDPGFAEAGLAELNRWLPLCWWSIYTLHDGAPPDLHAHARVGDAPDGTGAAWRAYRGSLYRRDATFAAARPLAAEGSTAMLHWRASEIPSDHRAAIYSAHGLRERLSIAAAMPGQGLLAINLYRHQRQAALEADAIEAVGRMAQPLLACVRKHIALRARETAAAGSALDTLTTRERQVCERLLKGWTQEGVAVDLGLTPATVKTYRDRAFRKLGIRSRHQLPAAVAPRVAAH